MLANWWYRTLFCKTHKQGHKSESCSFLIIKGQRQNNIVLFCNRKDYRSFKTTVVFTLIDDDREVRQLLATLVMAGFAVMFLNTLYVKIQ